MSGEYRCRLAGPDQDDPGDPRVMREVRVLAEELAVLVDADGPPDVLAVDRRFDPLGRALRQRARQHPRVPCPADVSDGRGADDDAASVRDAVDVEADIAPGAGTRPDATNEDRIRR